MIKKILFLTILFFSFHAQAVGIKHDFIVHLGIFDASRTSFEYNFDKKNYLAKSEVKTNGLFDTVYPFIANYYTSGSINKDNIFKTEIYRYQSQTRTNKRSKEMVYNEQGLPIYRISTKNNKSKKVDIQQDKKNEGTTDLQTVFAEMSKQYTELRFCDSRMEVFDGKRRFDVVFKDEGEETIISNEYSPYGGLAHKCSLYIDKLDTQGDDLLWQITSERPIYFWILEEQKTKLPFIARIFVNDTPLGELNVYTQQITVKD